MRHRVVHGSTLLSSPPPTTASSAASSSLSPSRSSVSARLFSSASSSSSTTTPSSSSPTEASSGVRRSLLKDLNALHGQEEIERVLLARAATNATTTGLQDDTDNEEEEEEASSSSFLEQKLLLPRPYYPSSSSSSWWWPKTGSKSTAAAASNNNNNSNNKMPTKKDTNNGGGSASASPSSDDVCSIPKFAYRELTLGRVVGQGGFSMVHEVTSMDLDDVYDTSEHETALRKDFARLVNASSRHHNGSSSNSNSNSSKGRYVLKTLRTDLPEDEHAKGVLDLAIEADFLSLPRIRQCEHFIRMVAMANGHPTTSNRFFVVLERLDMTLEKKFNAWRKIVTDNAGYYLPCFGYCCSKTAILHALWLERFRVALDIASAMLYLHQEGIVYRDLKPDNIGFAGNAVKLFDFGLAKRLADLEPSETVDIDLNAPDDSPAAVLPPSGSNDNGPIYALTGNTGSLRYMAPEVARDECYGLSVDVYSFGIIFWQICSLQTPYSKYTAKMHAERVVRQGQRPKPDTSWPRRWVALQQSCWSSDYTLRPSFAGAIVPELTDMVQEMEHDDGVIPTRATELIRAKKKKKPIAEHNLDVDTRISSAAAPSTAESGGANGTTNKRFDNDIV